MGVKELSEALAVPRHFLAKILQELSRQGLISSAKGPTGGFFLSESNRSASLIDVIRCIDGPEVFTSCILGLPMCSSERPCALHEEAMEFRQSLMALLKGKSIAELAEDSQGLGINL